MKSAENPVPVCALTYIVCFYGCNGYVCMDIVRLLALCCNLSFPTGQ